MRSVTHLSIGIAALLLGTASAAYAQPSESADVRGDAAFALVTGDFMSVNDVVFQADQTDRSRIRRVIRRIIRHRRGTPPPSGG